MRIFHLAKERRTLRGHSTALGLFSVCMYAKEDLCVSDHERRIRDLITWLNERGCSWHIQNDVLDEEHDFEESYRLMHHGFAAPSWNQWRLAVYDEETAVLLKMFFEDFEEVIDPPILVEEPVSDLPSDEETAVEIDDVHEAQEDHERRKREIEHEQKAQQAILEHAARLEAERHALRAQRTGLAPGAEPFRLGGEPLAFHLPPLTLAPVVETFRHQV